MIVNAFFWRESWKHQGGSGKDNGSRGQPVKDVLLCRLPLGHLRLSPQEPWWPVQNTRSAPCPSREGAGAFMPRAPSVTGTGCSWRIFIPVQAPKSGAKSHKEEQCRAGPSGKGMEGGVPKSQSKCQPLMIPHFPTQKIQRSCDLIEH